MTLLVVLILVVLWAAVLGPRIVHRLREQEPLGSVDSFYHELHLLERAAPKTVVPANRLETAQSPWPGSTGYPSVSSMPGRPSLVLLPPVGSTERADDPADRGGYAGRPSLAARDRVYRVRQSRRRRRDILLALVAVMVFTGGLGMMHSFRSLWDLTMVAGVVLVAYLALAVRAQQLAVAHRNAQRMAAREARYYEALRREEQDDRRAAAAERQYVGGYRDEWQEYGGYGMARRVAAGI